MQTYKQTKKETCVQRNIDINNYTITQTFKKQHKCKQKHTNTNNRVKTTKGQAKTYKQTNVQNTTKRHINK